MREEDFENVSGGSPMPLLPPGIYPARQKCHKAKKYSWREKLIFTWKTMTSPDQLSDVDIPGFYNLERDGGGRYKFGAHHAYRKDWIVANGGKLPGNPNRLPLTIFRERLLLVEVVTVTRDQRGPLHPSCFWSKVGRVVRPVEDGETFRGFPLEDGEIP